MKKFLYLHDLFIDVFLGGILILYLLFYTPNINELHEFCITPYFLRYADLGFISRGVIGSTLGLFFPKLSVSTLWVIILLNEIVLIILTILFLKKIRLIADEKTKLGILFLSLVFIVNPGSIAFLFYWGNFGRFDLFMILALILSCFIIVENRQWSFISLISIVAICIHQGFLFSYFPCILGLCFFCIDEDPRKIKSLLLIVILSSFSFLLMQFGGKIEDIPYDEVILTVQNNTDYPIIGSSMIRLEYFTDIFDFIPVYVLPVLKKNIIKCFIVIILMLPVEIILINIWKEFIKNSNPKYIIIPLIILVGTAPKFIITCDYGRDFSSVVISQFIAIFSLFAKKNRAMEMAIVKFQIKLRKHFLLALGAIIELSIIGKFQAANILELSDKLYQLFYAS